MNLAGARVLVVDDEPVLNLTMGLLLQRGGAVVHRAANGAEALAILEKAAADRQRVDAMVCDQNMPMMDGRTLLRTLSERGLTLPTLFFVSAVDREDTAALERMHVRRLITKPIQPIALLAAVSSVLAELTL